MVEQNILFDLKKSEKVVTNNGTQPCPHGLCFMRSANSSLQCIACKQNISNGSLMAVCTVCEVVACNECMNSLSKTLIIRRTGTFSFYQKLESERQSVRFSYASSSDWSPPYFNQA